LEKEGEMGNEGEWRTRDMRKRKRERREERREEKNGEKKENT
jgi:hypothetical protein